MKASRVLVGALAVLERYGWCQHQTVNAIGARCVLGAMSAADPFPDNSDAVFDLRRVIDWAVVPNWNDDRTRTFDEVREGLLAAASLAMSEEAL